KLWLRVQQFRPTSCIFSQRWMHTIYEAPLPESKGFGADFSARMESSIFGFDLTADNHSRGAAPNGLSVPAAAAALGCELIHVNLPFAIGINYSHIGEVTSMQRAALSIDAQHFGRVDRQLLD